MSTAAPSGETQPAASREPGPLRTLAIAHGAFSVVFGLLLIAIPGRTLTLIAVLAGISLCLFGVVDIARAFLQGLTGSQRATAIGMGVLALAAGLVVIARPDSSLRVIVVAAGVYLVLWGVARIVLGERDVPRSTSAVHGALALVAGAVLLAWPDVTVGAMATIYGIFLLTLGAAEILFGLTRRRTA